MLSAPTQSAQIERLGNALVGNHEMVLAILVALRVHFETIPVDDAVLQAVDRLAARWLNKLPAPGGGATDKIAASRQKLAPS